jgi:hypothetical protein
MFIIIGAQLRYTLQLSSFRLLTTAQRVDCTAGPLTTSVRPPPVALEDCCTRAVRLSS